MANFDEHHPDVAKINPGDYYDPNTSEWTMEMEKVVLQFLICQKEGVERGAKKAYLSLSLGMIAELLWERFRIIPPQIHERIEQMEMRYNWWKELLDTHGVFKNAERGLVCIDTTIVKTLTDEVTFLYGEELASRRPPSFRQPPPPPRRHSSGSPMVKLTDSHLNTEEEGNSVIDVPKKRVKVKNGRSHSYYLRSLKTNINSLPDEIVFDILVKIPAQDIYSTVRPVCLKWYRMIHTHNFVNTHLHRSTYGLLIQNRSSPPFTLTFMALSRQGRVELTTLNYDPGFTIWCNSCNGLILETERDDKYTLYISNPATMQRLSLPRSPIPLFGICFLFSVIAYASLSMKYKVVRACPRVNQWRVAILTVGADESWRPVNTQHLSLEAKKLLIFHPFTTEGFVHWVNRGNLYVLTLNMETEIITEYLVPSSCFDDRFDGRYYYFPTVNCLSLLIYCRRWWSWEVWEMKPETGEWTNLPGIELNDRKCEILEWYSKRDSKSVGYSDGWLEPFGWLKYGEVLICCFALPREVKKHQVCIAYNVRSKEIEYIELDCDRKRLLVHRNNLLWLDGY
ncbi:hypothetical protein CASFOL_031112 [Castilleja foliolosa]|uniref:F-box domain-containing protein n=1 Tax=Castilleja foliolosa TaxID=1961234 RepID=A0ABD3C575_9LAMI